MAAAKPVRTLLLIIMDLLVVLAVALVVRIVVEFFGVLMAASWAKAVLTLTKPLVLPFGVAAITTPYGGHFNVNAALSVAVLLAIEWAVSIARRAS